MSRGKPLQIIKIRGQDGANQSSDNLSEDSVRYEFDEAAFQELLDNNPTAMRDKPVCIVTIAGAFRRGKSFMLDFFLRYLHWQEAQLDVADVDASSGASTASPAANAWLGSDTTTPLEGFSWRGGSERQTTGILIWSKIFNVRHTAIDSDVAVIVMDTQGAFDSSSTIQDCATIFALSAMLSSVLVYNLTANLQEDDLHHLELFTDYGRLAMEDCDATPFQRLTFLIRDWSYPYDMSYGAEGGQQLVDKRLQVAPKQAKELQTLRNNIRSCFSDIEGFLLPHPGLKVATDPQFRGQLADIDASFLEHLAVFVPHMLSPDRIVVKEMGGNQVRVRDVLPCLQAYASVLNGDAMPEPKRMLQATSEANNMAALSDARLVYTAAMDQLCGPKVGHVSRSRFADGHANARKDALASFKARRKMGGEAVASQYLDQLDAAIDTLRDSYHAQNDAKRMMKSAGTPVTLAVIALIFYVMSTVFYIVDIQSFSWPLAWMYTLTVAVLIVWVTVKSTGHFVDIGEHVDDGATLIWDSFIQPLITEAVNRVSAHVAGRALVADRRQ